MTLRCTLGDAELARIDVSDDGRTVRLRFSALPAERPSPWRLSPESGWLRGVVLTLHGVAPAAVADGTASSTAMGRVREATVVLADATPLRALPCPWRHAGALQVQLQLAQGEALQWQAAGAALALAEDGDAEAAFSASLAC